MKSFHLTLDETFFAVSLTSTSPENAPLVVERILFYHLLFPPSHIVLSLAFTEIQWQTARFYHSLWWPPSSFQIWRGYLTEASTEELNEQLNEIHWKAKIEYSLAFIDQKRSDDIELNRFVAELLAFPSILFFFAGRLRHTCVTSRHRLFTYFSSSLSPST